VAIIKQSFAHVYGDDQVQNTLQVATELVAPFECGSIVEQRNERELRRIVD
jgi:hypothetical protein